jgi:hypothetical protein
LGPGFRVAQAGGAVMRIDGDGDDLLWDDDDEDTDEDDREDEDEDTEDDDAWPEFRFIPDMPEVPVQAAEPPANQVSARFMVVTWVVIIPALLGIVTGFWISGASGRHHAIPHPAPFSCTKVLAAGQGAAIYPLCNQWQAHEEEVTP